MPNRKSLTGLDAEELDACSKQDDDDADRRGHREHRACSEHDFDCPLRPVTAPGARSALAISATGVCGDRRLYRHIAVSLTQAMRCVVRMELVCGVQDLES